MSSTDGTRSAAEIIRELRATAAASPNDFKATDELARQMLDGGIGGSYLSVPMVVGDPVRIAELERELSRCRERAQALDNLLRRANQTIGELRYGHDPVTGHGEACGRPDCTATRHQLTAVTDERNDLRKRLMRDILRPDDRE